MKSGYFGRFNFNLVSSLENLDLYFAGFVSEYKMSISFPATCEAMVVFIKFNKNLLTIRHDQVKLTCRCLLSCDQSMCVTEEGIPLQ